MPRIGKKSLRRILEERKLKMRKKRQNEEFREKERIKSRERQRRLRENEAYRQLERQRNLQRKRQLRSREEYRQKERERERMRKRNLRKNEDYRNKEREKNRERLRLLRQDAEYLHKQRGGKWNQKLESAQTQKKNLRYQRRNIGVRNKRNMVQEEEFLRKVLTGDMPKNKREQINKHIIEINSEDIVLPESFLVPKIILHVGE